jgi:hypothetical protein
MSRRLAKEPFLRDVHPFVSCQSRIILVQAAVFAPLCSQACCISHSAHSQVTHASPLPLAHPPLPPTPLYYYYTVHRSLAQHPWVLRLANTSSSGPSRAFRQIIGSSLSLGERTLHDHMPADLSTHTTLPSNRPRLVSALTSTSSACNYASLD